MKTQLVQGSPMRAEADMTKVADLYPSTHTFETLSRGGVDSVRHKL